MTDPNPSGGLGPSEDENASARFKNKTGTPLDNPIVVPPPEVKPTRGEAQPEGPARHGMTPRLLSQELRWPKRPGPDPTADGRRMQAAREGLALKVGLQEVRRGRDPAAAAAEGIRLAITSQVHDTGEFRVPVTLDGPQPRRTDVALVERAAAAARTPEAIDAFAPVRLGPIPVEDLPREIQDQGFAEVAATFGRWRTARAETGLVYVVEVAGQALPLVDARGRTHRLDFHEIHERPEPERPESTSEHRRRVDPRAVDLAKDLLLEAGYVFVQPSDGTPNVGIWIGPDGGQVAPSAIPGVVHALHRERSTAAGKPASEHLIEQHQLRTLFPTESASGTQIAFLPAAVLLGMGLVSAAIVGMAIYAELTRRRPGPLLDLDFDPDPGLLLNPGAQTLIDLFSASDDRIGGPTILTGRPAVPVRPPLLPGGSPPPEPLTKLINDPPEIKEMEPGDFEPSPLIGGIQVEVFPIPDENEQAPTILESRGGPAVKSLNSALSRKLERLMGLMGEHNLPLTRGSTSLMGKKLNEKLFIISPDDVSDPEAKELLKEIERDGVRPDMLFEHKLTNRRLLVNTADTTVDGTLINREADSVKRMQILASNNGDFIVIFPKDSDILRDSILEFHRILGPVIEELGKPISEGGVTNFYDRTIFYKVKMPETK